MTPQRLDSQLEQLAEQGATADVLISLLLSENVPSDRATKIATDWVNYVRQKNKSVRALDEFERMVLIFLPRCKQVYDPMELSVESPEQWAKNIAREAIDLCREREMKRIANGGLIDDESITMKIGTKVREIEIDENMELVLDANGQKKYVEGYYHEGKYFEAPGKYGIVIANPAIVEAELKPFSGYEHCLDDLRVRPIMRDGVEASPEVQGEHKSKPVQGYELGDPAVNDQTREFDYEIVEFMSNLICVQWFLADGTEIEESVPWHPSISLEEMS